MLGKVAGEILGRGINAIENDVSNEKSKVKAIFRKIASHPLKVVASFISAPILVIKIAWLVENSIRRVIAVIGLLLSLILSYSAGTFLGSLVGAAFIATIIGILTGLGFLFGTTLSIYLSVIFSIIVFNAVSFVFLKISSQDIAYYLYEISN